MKRFFTILLACVLTLPLAAQVIKTKKVAILDVVDREGQLGYGMKLQLRASLTSAITQTPGYEGYDRVDMAAIFGEHDFQRTGAVSDEQIKKLGEMSGCDYVLITEAAKIDSDNLILVAKVVNVTTSRVESSADNIITADATGCREGSKKLAAQLFETAIPTQNTRSITQPENFVAQGSWGQSNPQGQYEFNRPIPRGVAPYMTYKQYKGRYSTKNYNPYLDTKYSPWIAATNVLIPGLGEICCGEFGRALLFVLPDIPSWILAIEGDLPEIGIPLLFVSRVWSILDTIKVAKIKSMYDMDMNRIGYGCTFDVSPSLECIPTYNGLQTSAGMKLTVTF